MQRRRRRARTRRRRTPFTPMHCSISASRAKRPKSSMPLCRYCCEHEVRTTPSCAARKVGSRRRTRNLFRPRAPRASHCRSCDSGVSAETDLYADKRFRGNVPPRTETLSPQEKSYRPDYPSLPYRRSAVRSGATENRCAFREALGCRRAPARNPSRDCGNETN